MTDMDKMMIEKVARAIFDAIWPLADWEGDSAYCGTAAKAAARAAIAAYNPDDRLREALESDDECDISEHELEVVLQEAAFVHGAQACREMMARFVENGPPTDPKVLAGSIRANWHPGWGDDPGKLPGSIPHNAFGETEETDALLAALSPLPQGDG